MNSGGADAVKDLQISSLTAPAAMVPLKDEKAVIGEPTKVLMEGGSIHPLNKTVMNYIDSMADYKQSLTEVIVSKPSTTSSGMELDSSEFVGKANLPLVLHLLWIIKILKVNLKASWKRVLDFLRKDGLDKLGSFLSGPVSIFVSRQRLKAFDAKFKDVVTSQSEKQRRTRFEVQLMYNPS